MSPTPPPASAVLPPLDVRPLFAPLLAELLGSLRSLSPAEWSRPASRNWTVRDVAAHLVDGDCRQLSFGRDRLPLLPPDRPIRSADDFLGFLDGLNADWITATRRLSPELLVSFLELTGRQVVDYFSALELDAPAIFAVGWAGHRESPNWLHLARELTERWHHLQQIRRATGRPFLDDPRLARPVLETFLYALPPAFHEVEAPDGTALEIRFQTPVDKAYQLVCASGRWTLTGTGAPAQATIEMDAESGWLALTRSIPIEEARDRARSSGPSSLTEPFFHATAIHKRPV